MKQAIHSMIAAALVCAMGAAVAQTAGSTPGQQGHDMAGHGHGAGTMGNMAKTGDPDHDFAAMMRSHHQMGIDMAKTELRDGKDPEMQKMARKVVEDQTKEVAKLDAWLAKHKPKGQ